MIRLIAGLLLLSGCAAQPQASVGIADAVKVARARMADVPPPPVDDGTPAPIPVTPIIPDPLPPIPPDPQATPILPEPAEVAQLPPLPPTAPGPRRRLYLYTASWCGWCVPQRATIDQFAREQGLSIGIYTGPPKPTDADILVVDIDRYPSKAGITSLPAIRVVEATEIGRLVGLQQMPGIAELWNRGRPAAVGLSGGTLPARQYVDLLMATLGKGSVEVRPGVTVNLAGNVTASLQRSGGLVGVTFNPAPQVRIQRLGLTYDATLNGMAITERSIVLRLGGLPDLTFGVE